MKDATLNLAQAKKKVAQTVNFLQEKPISHLDVYISWDCPAALPAVLRGNNASC